MAEAASMFVENLKAFGLTGQEALIYETLLKHGPMSGYEVAKETGISRSNVYSSLSGLVDKGAAYAMESETTKYMPENVVVFSKNILNDMSKRAEAIIKNAPAKLEKTEGYLTISGDKNIKNKINEMLEKCELRIYLQAEAKLIEEYRTQLEKLVKAGKKVVILSDKVSFDGASVYKTEVLEGQIRFISDSSYVLTGTVNGCETDTCLYSGEQNLVAVMKEALKNKIVLIEHNMEEKQ